MSFPERFLKKKEEKSRNWMMTGWGEKGDQPNPFTRIYRRAKQDAEETVQDLQDEPKEVPYRIRERLRFYRTGRDK